MYLQKKLSTVALGMTRYSTFKLIATAGFSKYIQISYIMYQQLENTRTRVMTSFSIFQIALP